jgi:hypothetical protein
MSIRDWIYTPGFYCHYLQHNNSRISNNYYKGVQCLKLYKSMKSFINDNRKYIPKENLWILRKYRNKLFTIFVKQKIRKLLNLR